MSAPMIFNVLTEFRFEIGHALLGSKQLTEAVHGLSGAADQALGSFQHLAVGVAAQMGLGTGGMLGTLYSAIKASDKFTQTQIALSNIMGSSAGSFEERMTASATIMERVNKLASEFALPADELMQMTKLMAPMLASKQMAGPNFSNAIDISRNLLKSAPTLGIDPGLVQGQLLRMIEGQASMGDTLFTRLISDTQTMSKFKSGSQGFNALDATTRIKTIMAAMGEFAKDTKVLEANVKTLNGQMTLLKNNFSGFGSALEPIGRMINNMIIPAMIELNAFINNQGRAIAKSLSRFIEPFMQDWRSFIVNLMQTRSMFSDLKSVTKILTITGSLIGLGHALDFFGIKIPMLSGFLHGLSGIVNFFGKPIAFAGTGFINGFLLLVSRLVAPFMLIFGVFQLISRAAAYGKIEFFESLAKLMPKITEGFAVISRVFGVFLEGFDNIAKSISGLFNPAVILGVDVLGRFVDVFVFMGDVAAFAVAGFQAITFAIMEFVNQLKSLVTGGGFSFGAIGDAFNSGAQDIFERIYGKVNSGDAIVSSVVNIGKVEQSFQFKEQMEPDRVAFTVKEQLMKAATNPTQGRSQRPFSFAANGGF